jgi:anti-sigma B factor antagonist
MKIDIRHREGITIIAPQGKITIGAGDIALREAVGEALEAAKGNILADLSGVTTIDSSGIGELVSAYTTVTNRGRKLALMNLPGKVADLLQITQLYTVFDIHDSEDEAISAMT